MATRKMRNASGRASPLDLPSEFWPMITWSSADLESRHLSLALPFPLYELTNGFR